MEKLSTKKKLNADSKELASMRTQEALKQEWKNKNEDKYFDFDKICEDSLEASTKKEKKDMEEEVVL